MTVPSFAAPTWATTGTPADSVLTAGLRANGWATFDVPTNVQFNRILYEICAWVSYFDDEILVAFELEHHSSASTDALGNALSAGAHKDVDCASLSVRAEGTGSGQGGTISFPQAGSASDNRALISLGALGSGDIILKLDHPATDAIELELGGGVWRSTLAGGATWAFEVNSASNKDLYIRNTGAGNANVSIDGQLVVGSTAVLSSTLSVTGASTFSGQVNANAGTKSDVDATYNLSYQLDAAETYEADITPEAGGYSIIHTSSSGSTDIWHYSSATPPYIAPSSTTSVFIRRPLRLAHNATNAPSSSGRRVVTGVDIYYYRADASATITWRLVEVSRAGGSARTVLESRDESSHFTTTASWDTYTDTFGTPRTMNESANYYYVEFEINQGGTDQCRIGPCHLTMTTRDATRVYL